MIDSLFRLLEGVDPRRHCSSGTALEARRLRAGHPAPPGAGRRPGAARADDGGARRARRVDCRSLFPVHPRTRARLEAMGFAGSGKVTLTRADGLRRLHRASRPRRRLVVTDSGGVQEETTVLGTPCLTYRTTTERPITVELGTNELIGVDPRGAPRGRPARARRRVPGRTARDPALGRQGGAARRGGDRGISRPKPDKRQDRPASGVGAKCAAACRAQAERWSCRRLSSGS